MSQDKSNPGQSKGVTSKGRVKDGEGKCSTRVASLTLSDPNISLTHPNNPLTEIPPDLREVVDAWSALPKAVRAGIMAMVKAARKGGGHE
jgi:hypothetical protein